jgi:hypothetical protein
MSQHRCVSESIAPAGHPPVLHIATVHHRSPRWIEIQTRELERHISVPYETWTSLQGIDASYAVHFDHVVDQAGAHPGKLNHLALEISHQADPGDLLMFLDGDAFPVADPMPLISESLAKAPLVAVRRAENQDLQPHPSFCVTTVGMWHDLPGDWTMGHRWQGPDGRRPTDVGANLLRALELTSTPWVDVLRSNPEHLDPLLFAIYGDVVYHHGAGFRRRGGASRAHYDSEPKRLSVPDNLLLRALGRQIDSLRVQAWRIWTRGPQIRESQRVFAKIERDDPGWLEELR